MQNPRELSDFKWVICWSASDLFREAKKRKEPRASKVWLKIFHYSSPPHCHHIVHVSFVLNSSHLSHLLLLFNCEYLLHFVTLRNPHHSTGIHYARWFLNTSSKSTPTRKKPKKGTHAHTKYVLAPNSLLFSRTSFLWIPPHSCEEHDLNLHV